MNKDEFYGYSVRVIRLSEEDGGGWLAEVPELGGCLGDGNTPQEALERLKDALECWLEVAKEEGKSIPSPRIHKESEYSGKFTLRIPKSLHRQLAEEAMIEGVSLNQYIQTLISVNWGKKLALSTGENEFSKWILSYLMEAKKAPKEIDYFASIGRR